MSKLTHERAKQLYTPYDEGQMRHLCALRDVEIGRLRDENAKLRELVRDMWEGYNDPRCEDCPLKNNPSCVDCPICAREAAVIDRMRELGVEV